MNELLNIFIKTHICHFFKCLLAVVVTVSCSTRPAIAQISIDQYLEDGKRYVCSSQVVLYDDFFHSASFAVAATADTDGLVTFSLEVTYDEGMMNVSQGDSLIFTLRGGDHILLLTDRDVTQADIIKRHFKTRNEYYITCHYAMKFHDIQRITRTRSTKLRAQTDGFTFDRKLEGFQDRFRRQFIAVYRYLMNPN